MSGRRSTRHGGKKTSSKSQPIQPAPKKGTKRTRSDASLSVSSVAENEEAGTARNKQKRSKKHHRELDDEQDHLIEQQEEAFMMYLDDVNSDEVFQNREIRKGLFTRYFKETRAGEHENASKSVKAIGELLANRLKTIETYDPDDRISAKDVVHKLQRRWKGWSAFFSSHKNRLFIYFFAK
jgi:hypothetical protein